MNDDFRDRLYYQDKARQTIIKDKIDMDRQIKKNKTITYISYLVLYGGVAFFLMWFILS